MNCRRIWIVRVVWLAVLLCVFLSLSTGAVKSPDSGLPPGLRRILGPATPEEKAIARQHLGVDFRMVDISLEVREQEDFLLTPALLVQEAISHGVILTYPEE